MQIQHDYTSSIKLFVFALAVVLIAGAALAFGIMDGGRDLIMANAEAEALRADTAWLEQQRQIEAPHLEAERVGQSEVWLASLEREATITREQTAADVAAIQDRRRLDAAREEHWLQFQERAWYLALFVAFFLAVGLAVTLLYLLAQGLPRLLQNIPSAQLQYQPRPELGQANGARRDAPKVLSAQMEVWRPARLRPHSGNQNSQPLISHEQKHPIWDENRNSYR